LYRLEVADPIGNVVLSAIIRGDAGAYRSPPWLKGKAALDQLKWRLIAFDSVGTQIEETDWRGFRLGSER
jgi:hypothetical protein